MGESDGVLNVIVPLLVFVVLFLAGTMARQGCFPRYQLM